MERRMYINGNWQEAQSGKKLTLTSPTDSSIIAVVTKGDVEDARLAITAAKIAFQPGSVWRKTSEEQRSKLFLRTAELMEERIELFANAESECNGRHLRETRNDAMSAAGLFRYYAGILGQVTGSTFNMSDGITSMTMLEPVGVVGGITPWNYPLMIACGIIAPALAAGNTVVLKPASNTPLTSILLFEVLDAVGFPEGVVNLVLGGGDVGEEIVRSFDVDMVMFIGGTETGRRIMQAASNNVKRVALELGGKSPVIVFDDCNLEATVDHVLMGIFLSSGQVCTAGSRIIVQEEIYDEFVNRVAERASKIRVGRYDDVSAQIGPLASEAHLKNVMAYIETGIDEGARLVTGGKQFKTEALANGYFLEPTVFADVRNSMKIAQNEIFGPVLCIERFSNIEEALKIANDTKYGLAGYAFTTDLSKALRVAKEIEAGNICINGIFSGHNYITGEPFKQSGFGLSSGVDGMRAYMKQKIVNINWKAEKMGFFD